jgi:hemerythrin-like domain-containing protein
MAGPMQMYVYIHDAILREVAQLEVLARELDRDDADEVAGLAERMGFFNVLTRKHEDTEEQVLFPAMNDRIAFVAETYLYDHGDFDEHVWAGIDGAFAALGRADGSGDRKEGARRLWRESVALHEHMRLHISKENELLLPHLEAEFDLAEQAELAGAMAGLVEPALMGQFVAWIYQGQTNDDREGMLRFLQTILPPEAFGGITGMLSGLGDPEWREMQRRIPELSAR